MVVKGIDSLRDFKCCAEKEMQNQYNDYILYKHQRLKKITILFWGHIVFQGWTPPICNFQLSWDMDAYIFTQQW